MLCCDDQISVVTVYGFLATVVILILPLVTELYELRKFWLERSTVEPCSSPDELEQRRSPSVAIDEAPAPATETETKTENSSPLKPMKRSQRSASEITLDDGVPTQTDAV